MKRLTRLSVGVILLIEVATVLLVAWQCHPNPGGCNWPCEDDTFCRSDYSCVNGVCWNVECDEDRTLIDEGELEFPLF